MPYYLGIDTSNYKTSLCLFDSDTYHYTQQSLMLSVKEGALGIRQNDALFLHTKQLLSLFPKLFETHGFTPKLHAVGASVRPRDVKGSYMPCFLGGNMAGISISSAMNIPFYEFSHQAGHILAGLYCCEGEFSNINQFYALHLSGGTSDILLVTKNADHIVHCQQIGGTLDINTGQLIDRAGVMLGLSFPCGAELEQLYQGQEIETMPPKLSVKETYFNFSGHQNKLEQMVNAGVKPSSVAKYTMSAVTFTVLKSLQNTMALYGKLPILFVGGVCANTFFKETMKSKLERVFFAQTQLSGDNALGIAYGAYLKHQNTRKMQKEQML